MEIRKFRNSDIRQIVTLFYQTVHSVNGRDYSLDQLDAWAPRDEEDDKIEKWTVSMGNNITYVADINGKIVGFSDMTKDGHLDRLFVHKDFQGQGIASALVNTLEIEARRLELLEIDTDASITAKEFFEHHGYKVIQLQTVERRGIKLNNFKMIKKLATE